MASADLNLKPAAGTRRGPLGGKKSSLPMNRPISVKRSPLHFWLFVVPGLVGFLVFIILPLIMAAISSVTDENAYRPIVNFVGAENYINLFQDPMYLKTLSNTAILTGIQIVVPNVIGLSVALLLDRTGWAFNAMRAIFFIPIILSSVVVAVIWQAILKDDGILNLFLRSAGMENPPGWLSDPNIALYSIGWISSWQAVGMCVVIYLAGLQGIPRELTEAAAIDGAGPLTRFKKITWPLLAPAFTIMTVLLMIGGLKIYDPVKVMTNGGPGVGTTTTLAFDVVGTGIEAGSVGYGAAKAVSMFIMIAIVSLVTQNLLRKREVDL